MYNSEQKTAIGGDRPSLGRRWLQQREKEKEIEIERERVRECERERD